MIRGYNYVSICIFLLLAVGASGCIDQIAFDSKKSEGQLVVHGKIHDGPGPYSLQLGMTSSENSKTEPETGAIITIFNHEGEQEIYSESESEPGLYLLRGDVIKGERGGTYHIEIELQDGRRYSSIPETIPLHTVQNELILEPGMYEQETSPGTIVESEGVYIYANTDLPAHDEPLFLKWNLESLYLFRETEPASPIAPPANTCYVTNSINPQTISLYASYEPGPERIQRQFFGIKDVVPEQFYIRHYINIISSSITERRYQYWQNVDNAINQTGTIFDLPPATIPGNILNEENDLNEALGYFEASAMDTSRAFIVRSDLETYISNPCPQGFSQNRPSACSNCLQLENSTLERPHYLQ